MTKRHAELGVVTEEPKKLTIGLSLSERRDFVKLCEQTALPWQIQVGLVTSIAKGEIHSLDQMISFIEVEAGKGGGQSQSQKESGQRTVLWKVLSLPEMERLTVAQWDLYIQGLLLCQMYPFWSAPTLSEVSEWQKAWYRFFGLPVLPPPR